MLAERWDGRGGGGVGMSAVAGLGWKRQATGCGGEWMKDACVRVSLLCVCVLEGRKGGVVGVGVPSVFLERRLVRKGEAGGHDGVMRGGGGAGRFSGSARGSFLGEEGPGPSWGTVYRTSLICFPSVFEGQPSPD